MGVPSQRSFLLLIIFSRSVSGVVKGSYGVDLVCLPLEATAKTMELPVDFTQWNHHSGVASGFDSTDSPHWSHQVHSRNLGCTKF
jgi:hypothetical protein